MKYHLANVKYQNVVLCQQVPADVKQGMRELISKKDEAKEKKAREAAIRRGSHFHALFVSCFCSYSSFVHFVGSHKETQQAAA